MDTPNLNPQDPFDNSVLPTPGLEIQSNGGSSAAEETSGAFTAAEIEITPISAQKAIDEIAGLKNRAEALEIDESCSGWQGAGAQAMGDLIQGVRELDEALVGLLGSTRQMLQDALDEFEARDADLAHRM